MHYQVIVHVKLRSPLQVVDGDQATGYLMTVGVQAADLATATSYAQAAVIANAEQDDLEGNIVSAEIQAISEGDWPKEVLEQVTNRREPGVYFQSGRVFFDEAHGEKKWWQFWK